ncbi:MAG TPA: phosphatidylglycerol lysyltransferase domain-containing protein [Gaiellaceae bacterium]|nr:phosphatidylglycerol lysyltransferase domain-containing protein [Gaiellaceae bacterium]
MISLERHQLGPRVRVFGRRVHEWQLGVAVACLAASLRLANVVDDPGAALMGALAAWLVIKDWHDLFPSRRDTASWRPFLHKRVAEFRDVRRGDGLPGLAAAAAAVTGIVNICSTLTPNVRWRGHLLLNLEPMEAVPVFHALALPASAALIVTAFYLARRRQRALQAALVFLLLLGAFDLLKGLDIEEASLSWAVAALLWWGRDAFYVRHDPIRLRGAAWRVPAIVLGAYVMTAIAAFVAAPNAGFATVRREAVDLLLLDSGPIHFHHHLRWVPLGAALLGVLSLVAIAYVVFRPLAAPRSLPDPDVRRSAAELVRRHGTDTLSYFKLRRDTHYIFSSDRRAFVGYRIENGVLLVSGDPVGPDDALPALAREVCRHSERHGLELAAMGASERMLPFWREAGLRTLYVGDEAIVDTNAFSLEGRSIRKVRQSVSRLEAAGFDSILVKVADLDDETAAELEHVSSLWRDGSAERGFSMALDAVCCKERKDGRVVFARDAEGRIRGFIHFVPSYGRPAMSLSAMRRDRETPNGLMEFLVVRAIELLRAESVEELSLNFAAFARFMHRPRNPAERLVGRVARLANPYFQIESLYRFNAKFHPRWEPRYLVFERRRRLTRVGLAVMWAEGQLPKPVIR